MWSSTLKADNAPLSVHDAEKRYQVSNYMMVSKDRTENDEVIMSMYEPISAHPDCDRLRFDPDVDCGCPKFRRVNILLFPTGSGLLYRVKEAKTLTTILSGIGPVDAIEKLMNAEVMAGYHIQDDEMFADLYSQLRNRERS